MREFVYSRPETLSDILDILAGDPDARPLAGGMTLLPTMKQRLAGPSELVDLAGVPLLSEIEEDEGELQIGAMATHAAVAGSALVQSRLPGLSLLADGIGDVQVRNRGTIGGSIANNDPAADYPAAILALDAVVVTDRRELPADAFLTGLFETALEPGELVLQVRIRTDQAFSYAKFRHPVSGYAMTGVAVAHGSRGWRVAVTGAGAGAFRMPDVEQQLLLDGSPEGIDRLTFDLPELISDFHAGADYRANLVRVMTRRAVRALLGGQNAD